MMTDIATIPLPDLAVLARERLEAADPKSTLAAVIRRLFDRDDREVLTVSAFGSAL